MEYIDYYLKFPSKEMFETLIPAPDSEQAVRWIGVFIDAVGTIYRPTGAVGSDDEGSQFPVMEPTPGYHVNVRSSVGLPDVLQPFEISAPADPKRVWA